jgi:hypothetical protein
MTDREMLELAAKAGGYARHEYVENSARDGRVVTGHYDSLLEVCINPLTDDGDALRLKVNLHLIVGSYSTYSSVGGTYTTGNYTLPDEITVWHHETAGDACAAERLAITRAAAEIGRQMEETK